MALRIQCQKKNIQVKNYQNGFVIAHYFWFLADSFVTQKNHGELQQVCSLG